MSLKNTLFFPVAHVQEAHTYTYLALFQRETVNLIFKKFVFQQIFFFLLNASIILQKYSWQCFIS